MSANNDFLSFDFEAFEVSGGDKNQAVSYLKTLDLGLDFEDLENKIATYNQENQTQYSLYDALKSQSKSLKIRKPQVSSEIATNAEHSRNDEGVATHSRNDEVGNGNDAVEEHNDNSTPSLRGESRSNLKDYHANARNDEGEENARNDEGEENARNDDLGEIATNAPHSRNDEGSEIATNAEHSRNDEGVATHSLNDKNAHKGDDFNTFKQDYANEGLADKALQSAKEAVDTILPVFSAKEAVDTILPVFSAKEAISGDKRSQYLERIEQEIHKKIEQGGDFNSLDDAQKKFLEEKYQKGEEKPSIFDSEFWDKDRKKGAEGVFERLKSKHQIAQKEANSLSESEKSLVKEEVGFWNNAFNSVAGLFTDESKENRNFEDFKNAIKAKSEVTSEIQEAVNTLSLIHKNNNLLKILTSDNEESKALKEDYLQSLSKIAELHNFDDVGIDKKGEIYFFKTDESGNERAYHINTSFIDNFLGVLEDSKFEIGGSLIGAMAGAKKGLSKGVGSWQKVLFNAVAGSAIGAFSGAGVDYNLANAKLNREGDFEEFIAYASQAGLLDLAGSGVMAGISKVGVKEALSKTFKTAFNTADKIASNIPSFGFVYRTGKNFKQGQNFEGASKLIKESLSDEQRAAIDTLSKDFGGAVQSNAKDTTQQILSTLENVVNQKMPNSKLAEKLTSLNEALSDTSLASRRAKLVDYIRADESGLNVGILTQVASSNPKANLALRELLAKTSQSLENQLSNLKINQKDLREIFKGFESDSKEAYNQAIDKTLLSAFKEERVQVNPQDFAKFAKELQESGLTLEIKDKNFLQTLSKNLYNEKGVSLEQLVNLRKSLNANFKEIKDPNLKSHFQNAIENFIKKDIDKGIEDIFKSNPKVTTEALKLFKTANEEYSNLKSIIKNAKKLKVFDEAAKKEKIVRNITEFAKGQGAIKAQTSPFGVDFKEFYHKGKQAVKHLLEQKQGQVKGAFYREDLGDIDLVWGEVKAGNKGYGLAHIIDKHPEVTPELLEEITQKGILESKNEVNTIWLKKGEEYYKVGLTKGYKGEGENHWIVTAFQVTKEKDKTVGDALFTNERPPFNLSGANHTTNSLNNLESLTKGLKESDIKDIEMQVLEGLYKDNLKEFKNGLKIFDSTAFLDNLKNLQSYPFKSSEAKDFIKYTQDFHKLFSQDAKIASSIYEPKANNTSSTLATSISGALQVKFINGIMEAVMRNLSLPFFLRGGELEQKIAKNALKYQLSKALEQSSGLSEFKQVLAARTKNGDFSNGTKKALEEFNKALEKTENEFYDSIKKIENNPKEEIATNAEHSLNDAAKGDNSVIASETKQSPPSSLRGENPPSSLRGESRSNLNKAQNAGNENIALRANAVNQNEILEKMVSENEKNPQSLKQLENKEPSQEAQEQWLKTFNLKSIDEDFIPNFAPEVKEALEPILKGENIHLGKGSLVKLEKENRLKYLNRIKPTLESPDRIILQNDGVIIFAKNFNEKKYFTSVSKDENGKWIIASNAPKSENGLNNKIKNGGRELYQADAQINANAPYDDIAKSNTKLDNNDILPQNQNLSKMKEFYEAEKEIKNTGLSLKEARELVAGKYGFLANQQYAFDFFKEQSVYLMNNFDRFNTSYYKDTLPKIEKYENSIKEKLAKSEELWDKTDIDFKKQVEKYGEVLDYTTEKQAQALDREVSQEIREYYQEKFKRALERYDKAESELKSLRKAKQEPLSLKTTEAKSIRALRDELKTALSPILNKDIINKESGLIAKVSNSGLKKMMSENSIKKSIENGFTKEEHIKAASEIKNLFENAKLAAILEDLKNQKQDLKILRFNADLNINDKDANALITIKKSYDKESKNRIYNIELEELKSLRFKPEPRKQNLSEQPLSQNTKAEFLETDEPLKTDKDILPQNTNLSKGAKEEIATNAEHSRNDDSTLSLRGDSRSNLKDEPKGELETSPFGTDFKEFYHKGSEAVKHLLEQKQGQVKGAFYRKDLEDLSGIGNIDLVWGNEKYGLKHIIDKHGTEFKDLENELSEIIEKGKVLKDEKGRLRIKYQNKYLVGIKDNWEGKKTNNWVVTAYKISKK